MEYQNSQPAAAAVAGMSAEVPMPGGGRTVISETAVAKVAGIAARAVPGVYSLGSGPSRALGAFRDAVGSADHAAGVRAEVGDTQVAVDIDLVALYGTPLHALADQIRAAVYSAVEKLVGLQVIEVNIDINDVYVPGPAKSGSPAEARAATEAIQ
ncbi:Asp23/Gls24 family envelope stress response protein [Arthrobacter sp. H16F315]|uniref:Asp23/Gls24 family envelope stress response protein n=1 Tax=Arthrobacter sp. H16F315 TaxID=2955314 RepID=UPI002096E6B0|nr:Asp23/Gls24 family envelope stress response protein [Arthrobacter sp. H16F315]MDD1475876.1 Asp23/Gls24 family envelope stress response protein [Arthrobacter sp. H16F315]